MGEHSTFNTERIQQLLSAPRLGPYLREANGDLHDSLALYQWGSRVAASAFELIGHFEVLLRNALDEQLCQHFNERERGIPWFLMPMPTGKGDAIEDKITEARDRIRHENKQETRDQIIAGLEFGFWQGLLSSKHDTLWRECLHLAFPYSAGSRREVAADIDAIRKFRNRIAHHDSMVNVDVPFEVRRLERVSGWISPEAARWIESVGKAMEVYAEKPVVTTDTAVVAARYAWPLYQECRAYVCQAGCTFRPVDRIAFYADKEIKPDVPAVIDRRDNVEWTVEHANRLEASANRLDRKIGEAILAAQAHGWGGEDAAGVYQIFLLTSPDSSKHRQLRSAIPHNTDGRGSAFTQRQRYTALHQLQIAKTTSDLA